MTYILLLIGIYARESSHSIATTPTPRLTYTGLTGQIRALVSLEDSCSVAVAGGGKRGQVHVLRLDAAVLGADAHGTGNGVAGFFFPDVRACTT